MMTTLKKYRYTFLFILFCSWTVQVKAAVQEKTKVFEEVLEVSSSSEIEIEHLRGDLNIYPTDKPNAFVEVMLTVKGSDPEDIQKIIDKFTLDINKRGDHYSIFTNAHISSWVESHNLFGKKFKIKFDDGDVITNKIDDIEVEFKIHIPTIKKIAVQNKYNNINWGDVDCAIEANIYSGEIHGNSIPSDLKIESKYSKIYIGDIKNGDLNIYDSKLNMGSASDLVIRDKYSKIDLANAHSLELYLHDSNVETDLITTTLRIEAKYSDLEIDGAGSAKMDLHDSNIRLPKCGPMEIVSKYSSFILGEITDLEMKSHDDEIRVDKLCGLELINTKYSEYDVRDFSGKLNVISSHDDDLVFLRVDDFEGMNFTAKYSTISIPIEHSTPFDLIATMKYGSIDFDRSQYDIRKEIDKDSQLEIQAKTKGTNHKSVTIDAYDSKITLH